MKKRILIVDDEVAITDTLKRFLEKAGAYEVRTENQGSRVLAAARQFRPDLILLDIVLPERDGAAIAADLKGDPALQRIPIVFLTGLVTDAEVEASHGTIGGRPFLAKPVDLDRLLGVIEAQLGTPSGA